MDALILAAGYGTRLGISADGNPKPMVQVGNEPLLSYNIRKLLNIGVNKIFINSHYKYEIIRDFIDSNLEFKEKVNLIYEPVLLGTASTIKNLCKNEIITDLLVMHGDNYCEDSLVNLKKCFSVLGKYFFGVIGTFITDEPEKCGILVVKNGKILEIHEKTNSNYGNLANSAIYIFNTKCLVEITKLNDQQNDLSLHFIPQIIARLKPVRLSGEFIDIGTPKNLKRARLLAETN
jgi:mannose-1-phosphate guanylyltransferase